MKGGKHLQVYMAKTGEKVLEESDIWCCDGTHKAAPRPFAQIYIIGKQNMT